MIAHSAERNISTFISEHKSAIELVAAVGILAISLFFGKLIEKNSILVSNRPEITCNGFVDSSLFSPDIESMTELGMTPSEQAEVIESSCKTIKQFINHGNNPNP